MTAGTGAGTESERDTPLFRMISVFQLSQTEPRTDSSHQTDHADQARRSGQRRAA